jgi:hypothetical protein
MRTKLEGVESANEPGGTHTVARLNNVGSKRQDQ